MGKIQDYISKVLWKILNVIGFYRIKVDGHAYFCFKASPLVSNGEPDYIEIFKYRLHKSNESKSETKGGNLK
jgi:hypothetical protein